jgi:PAS domain S-box-containing protein
LIGGAGPLGVFDLDFTKNTYWFSPGWRTVLGYREDELANDLETFLTALPVDEQAAGTETWIQLRSPGQSTAVTPELLLGKDGQLVPVLLGMHRTLTRKRGLARVTGFICAAPLSVDSGLPAALIHAALETLAEGVLMTNSVGKIIHLNPAACRLLGVKAGEVRDQLASQVFTLVQRETGQPSDDPFTRALSESDPLPLLTDSALPARTDGGAPQPVVWTARACRDTGGRLQGVVILFRDPAELSLTPEELIKANRFESLGVVAGGIAHDFNDLLTTILAGISLNKDGRDPVGLEESEKACLSAKGLTKQLLAFAKGGASAHTIITADEVLSVPIKLASAGSDAAITVEVGEGTETVRVDRLQMAQVFQNLILNALQAMPGPPHRGRVHLRAANTTLAADQIPPLPAGAYVEFEVRDNASGIPPENQEKIFDPFFTTRKHRTGLGLPTALAIVRKHGGQIGVVSTPGEGTAFTVFLPRAEAPLLPSVQKAPTLRFRTGRILFMDDDPKITALTASMLESLDYSFDVAKDGAEAIQLYNRYLNIGRPYDVVILDVTVVGGMGGEECFKALRDVDPEVRAIISTGYENEAMGRRYLDLGFCGYLTKPYRVADLGKALKTVLG